MQQSGKCREDHITVNFFNIIHIFKSALCTVADQQFTMIRQFTEKQTVSHIEFQFAISLSSFLVNWFTKHYDPQLTPQTLKETAATLFRLKTFAHSIPN
ncbi:hypothetical protein CRP01_23495 [Flavilitoribacter nigricans DSM 23189 = NBRC 102662]|uniref:Uncharacterized protein n=1 Tax=Flavilitoribacter nigricans (strain ATCC 23147 / DSM 23189 / NBRC 102662 / NCIMB 1420 / SS-2) TaxID=1122177 RepID=A0A2D0N8R4_FLAN2|nr:hypothetical protein CRP01_23495 [Flavilitoribacter nigricans DSM 23189 = NBRC 102662]